MSPPPPTATKIASIGPRVLAQDLQPDGSLAGDHVGVVVGVHEDQPPLAPQPAGLAVGLVVGVAVKHHPGPAGPTASTLIRGVVTGITMTARHPEPRRRERDPLGMVAGGGGDHSPCARPAAGNPPFGCTRHAA